jgi:ADP-ribose pyrophosphatase YjhB (NUDIX family)
MPLIIVGAVIRNKKDKNKILLVQQAKGHTHEGMWGVPGGKVKEEINLTRSEKSPFER